MSTQTSRSELVFHANLACFDAYFAGYASTKHRIFPRTPDGDSLPERLIVSIDLTEIAFA